MARRSWNTVLLALSLPALAGACVARPAAVEGTTVLLQCEAPSPRPGAAIVYQVLSDGDGYTLVKRVGDHEVGKLELGRSGSVAGYGHTYLFFKNHGRSGYLLVYFHKGSAPGAANEKALIDVNLFQPSVRVLNSGGPRDDFRCETPP